MYSGFRSQSALLVAYGAFTSSRLSKPFCLESLNLKCGPNPGVHSHGLPLSLSLAATNKNRCFFLLRLLDVSVHGFPSIRYGLLWMIRVLRTRFPFRHLRIKGLFASPRLFAAYHGLSSALGAKASTLRSSFVNLLMHSVASLIIRTLLLLPWLVLFLGCLD